MLDGWRAVGDPHADAIVASLASEGPLVRIHDLLSVVRTRAASDDRCRAFLREATSVPAWADFAAMARG